MDATDDRGLAKVQFLDDDRVVCEDLAAPYECAYQPRGGDVGRNTLVAIAVDTAGQTTSVVRAVTVRRFTSPGLSLSLRPEPRSHRALLLPRDRDAAAARDRRRRRRAARAAS